MPVTGWRSLALLISIAGLAGGCAPVRVDAGEHADPRQAALQSPARACEHQDLPCPALVELGSPIRSRANRTPTCSLTASFILTPR